MASAVGPDSPSRRSCSPAHRSSSSASLAPHLAHEPLGRRLGAAYLLVDQNDAVAIARWAGGEEPPERRLPFFLGAGVVLWSVWQVSTVLGVLVGSGVPDVVPLDFAVPLVFLVLLVPAAWSPALTLLVGMGVVVVLEAL